MHQSPDIRPASALVAMSSTAEFLPVTTISVNNQLWDVFSDSSPSSPRSPTPPLSSHAQLQAAHHTAGYRDGISSGKESSLQPGFDEGYPLGAEMGQRAGRMMGILEACIAALTGPASAQRLATENHLHDTASDLLFDEIKALYQRASKELLLEQLLTADFFDENGVWKYEVSANAEDEDYTFKEVVGSHPTMNRWEGIISSLLDRIGIPSTTSVEGDDAGANQPSTDQRPRS